MNNAELLESQLKTMYSDSEENINKVHLDRLFPDMKDGCINFGYWESASNIISSDERINSQKALYRKLFSLLIPKKEQSILEIGSGRGHAVNWLHNEGINCYGIDALIDQIIKSKNKYATLNKFFIHGAAENIPFENDNFDGIYSLEAAQHFNSFEQFAKESFRVLKDKGSICISTYFFVSDESKNLVLDLIPNSIEGTHNAISIDQAISLLKKAGFVIEHLETIGEKVFPQYAKWQQQEFQRQVHLKSMAKQEKWADYYTGGAITGEHPWHTVFSNNWIDYYIIKARKL